MQKTIESNDDVETGASRSDKAIVGEHKGIPDNNFFRPMTKDKKRNWMSEWIPLQINGTWGSESFPLSWVVVQLGSPHRVEIRHSTGKPGLWETKAYEGRWGDASLNLTRWHFHPYL